MKKQSLINCIILIIFGSFCIGQQDMFSSGSNRPRANAGPDIQIIKDQKINLDASRSFIRDGSKLKFEWILSPGVALKSDNMLNNAISVDLYRDKYLKTIQTNEKILVIGDSLDNDIKGANLQNLDSLLITSGIHRKVNNHNGVDKEELNDLIKKKKICPKFIMRHLTF